MTTFNEEIIYVDEETVYCDGKGRELGHPVIYLSLVDKSEVQCPYCSCKFVHRAKISENQNI